MAKRICCPNILCKSTDVVSVSTKTKFSLRKAVIDGTVGSLFTPLGTVIGAASGINGKYGKTKFICQDCGKVLEKKLKFRWQYFYGNISKKV